MTSNLVLKLSRAYCDELMRSEREQQRFDPFQILTFALTRGSDTLTTARAELPQMTEYLAFPTFGPSYTRSGDPAGRAW